jgi:hypothetical protein
LFIFRCYNYIMNYSNDCAKSDVRNGKDVVSFTLSFVILM